MPAKLKNSDSHFIQVDIQFAKEHGLNEATLAGKMLRLQENLTGVTDDDGIKWIRLTLEEWCNELPFLGEMTIRRTIESLESKQIFLSTTFTGRSKWYRLNPDFIEGTQHNTTVQKEQIHYGNCAKRTDTTVQNEQLPRVLPIESITTTRDTAAEKLTDLYLLTANGRASRASADLINDILDSYPADIIIYACAEAEKNTTPSDDKRNLSYIEAVCKRKISGQPDKPYKNGNGAHQNGHNQTQTTYQGRETPPGHSSPAGQNAAQSRDGLTGTAKQLSDAIKRQSRSGD